VADYDVEITSEGLRHLDRLPAKVRAAAIELILGPLAAAPHRLGKALLGEFAGLFSAGRGDYRVVYAVDEARRVVTMHRVQHRRDVHRPH
jgi:mRNA interferase RelE/StbE